MAECPGCKAAACYKGEKCVYGEDFSEYEEASRKEFLIPENKQMMEVAARIEGEHYMEWTRLQEIIEFARQMGYRRLGLAHCLGLTSEARVLKGILEQFFAVEAVCCKFSGIDKKDYGLVQVNCDRYEGACDPIGQAMLLNDCETELNIVVGLCVGHDILFAKYSNAPVTTFIVKDRVTGHNPAAVLYSGYYKKKFK